jgi:hypothetical protein
MSERWSHLPDHAYIPGRTARHPEGWFDALRATSRADMSVDQIIKSDAWLVGIAYFEGAFFWEAHEVWEAVWLALPEGDERRFVQAAIQLANAGLKARMLRPNAVGRLLQIVSALSENLPDSCEKRFGFPLHAHWLQLSGSTAKSP